MYHILDITSVGVHTCISIFKIYYYRNHNNIEETSVNRDSRGLHRLKGLCENQTTSFSYIFSQEIINNFTLF